MPWRLLRGAASGASSSVTPGAVPHLRRHLAAAGAELDLAGVVGPDGPAFRPQDVDLFCGQPAGALLS